MAVDSYSDKNYEHKRAIYDVLAQIMSDMKYEMNGSHGWNMPVEELKGVTLRLIGEESLEITHHRFELATVEELAMKSRDYKPFLNEVERELRKRFEEYTGKKISLKKIDEHLLQAEAYGKFQAETSYIYSGKVGHRGGMRPYRRYLMRDKRIYDFSAKL